MRTSSLTFKRSRNAWLYFEDCAFKNGAKLLAGVDEVGRGCLAGPVVAAAVILPLDFYRREINDSKKLTPEKRLKAYRLILNHAVAYSVAMVEAPEIDRINILQASLKAMKIAIEKLVPVPDYILIDGRDRIPAVEILQRPIIGGDGRSVSIAAASIVAKVCRDRLMRFYSRKFPQYAFEVHKGYATQVHQKALQAHGPCALHRRSFAGIDEREAQMDLLSI